MPVNFGKKLVTGSLVLLLTGCSLFGKDKLEIDGERIAVMREDSSLAPDYEAGKVKIKLPAPYKNTAWAQNGGNAQHLMGHLQADSKLKELWDEGFGEGSSKRDYLIAAPIISYQVAFTIDADAKVSAFRLDNGKEIWSRRLKPANRDDKSTAMKGAGVAQYNKKIYATTGFGGIFCLDMLTGKEIWRYDQSMPMRIAPTVDNGKVFAQTIDNTIIALNADNGEEIWKYTADTEATTLVGGASPAYSAEVDVVIAAFSNGELRAFKASTGTPLWGDILISKKRTNSLANITAIKANPVIDESKVYAVGYNSVLAAFDLRTGARIWEREMGSTSMPWVAGKYLFVLTNNFDLLAIEKDTGKIVWNTIIPTGDDEDRNGVFGAGPVLVSDRLIVTTSNGYVFAVSPYTGEIISYVSMPDGVELSPIVADNTTIFATSDADLLAYK